MNFFLGAQHRVLWEEAKKFMLKKFMCFFLSLNKTRRLKSSCGLPP